MKKGVGGCDDFYFTEKGQDPRNRDTKRKHKKVLWPHAACVGVRLRHASAHYNHSNVAPNSVMPTPANQKKGMHAEIAKDLLTKSSTSRRPEQCFIRRLYGITRA